MICYICRIFSDFVCAKHGESGDFSQCRVFRQNVLDFIRSFCLRPQSDPQMDCVILCPVVPPVVDLSPFYPVGSIQCCLFDVSKMWIETSYLTRVDNRLHGPNFLRTQVRVILFEEESKKWSASCGQHYPVTEGSRTFLTDHERIPTKRSKRLDNYDVCIQVYATITF